LASAPPPLSQLAFLRTAESQVAWSVDHSFWHVVVVVVVAVVVVVWVVVVTQTSKNVGHFRPVFPRCGNVQACPAGSFRAAQST